MNLLLSRGPIPLPHYILRIEFSGIIVGVGSMVADRQIGDKVCGILEDQRCSEFIAIWSWKVISVPNGISVDDAALLPYAASVVFLSFIRIGKLMSNSSVMIHDGAGKFGALAIQLAKLHNCKVFTTGRNERELQYCKEVGADYCIKDNKGFADYVMRQTNRQGVDFVFDPYGDKLNGSWKILGHGGTYVVAESTHRAADIPLSQIGKRQIKLIGKHPTIDPCPN